MSSSTDRATAYAEAVVAGDIIAGPHVRNAAKRHIDDLENGEARGLRYDEEIAARALRFFETKLKLSEGQFEGRAFNVHPAQAFIIGSIFGWQRESEVHGWVRRFRRAYIEQGKGNGKSPLAGGIGLYGLMADGEAGAEIYAAGATKDQAGILFRDAIKMRGQSPDIATRTKTSGGEGKEYNLAYLKRGSFFRPISREAKRTGSGPRPHMALCDEVHEHPDRGVMEMLERGFKFRRQPLLLMITNSGSDRNSICWEEHEHAVRVAAGNREAKDEDSFYLGEPIDDTTFSYVCALDSERTETYPFDIAIRHAAESCTCNAQITLSDLPSPQDFAALVTQGSGAQIISQRGSGASITPSVRLLLSAFASTAIPRDAKNAARKPSSAAKNIRENGPSLPKALRATGNGTESTERESGRRTRTGAGTVHAGLSTGSPSSRLSKSAPDSGMDAPSAGGKMTVSEWITATIQELCGDCSATPAILESVCSEIMSRLYSGHSNTCKVRQRFRLASGRLTEDLPADDPLTDPTCWPKANPLLGVTIEEEYLAGVAKQARDMPGKLNSILRLHFCVWTDAETAWMTRAMLEPCIADFDPLELHRGKKAFLGADLSQVKDITAKGYCVQSGTVEEGEHAGKPTYDAWVMAWTPGDTMAARALVDKLDYERWVREGHLLAPKGLSINYRHVAQSLAEDLHNFDIECLAYDRYAFARMLEPEMQELGLSIECVEHPQGGTKKGKPTEAMKEAAKAAGREAEGLWMPMSVRQVEELILERRIRILRNPVLISAMMSAVTDEDRWGNYWLAKERAVNKIDAAVALCMAVGAACSFEGSSTKSFWEVA